MANNGGGNEGPEDHDADGTKASNRPVAEETELSLDATLELLANYDRRCVLDYLVEHSDGTVSMDELVNHVVRKKAKRTGERPGHDHVLSTLHHVHVPRLMDAGLVEYDARNREIRYWGNERVEKWHELVRSENRP